MAAWGTERREGRAIRWGGLWRRLLSLLTGAGAAAALAAAIASLEPAAAHAAGGDVVVTFDGTTVVLPNQGPPALIDLPENPALDCAPGTIVVGDRVEGGGRALVVAAGAGEAILAVSVKSGSGNASAATFSSSGAVVSTTQEISNDVVVTCRPAPAPPATRPVAPPAPGRGRRAPARRCG